MFLSTMVSIQGSAPLPRLSVLLLQATMDRHPPSNNPALFSYSEADWQGEERIWQFENSLVSYWKRANSVLLNSGWFFQKQGWGSWIQSLQGNEELRCLGGTGCGGGGALRLLEDASPRHRASMCWQYLPENKTHFVSLSLDKALSSPPSPATVLFFKYIITF